MIAFQMKTLDKLAPLVDREKLAMAVQRENMRYFKRWNEWYASYDLTYLTNPKLASSLNLSEKTEERLG